MAVLKDWRKDSKSSKAREYSVTRCLFVCCFVLLIGFSLLCFLVSGSSLVRGQPGHTVRLVPYLPLIRDVLSFFYSLLSLFFSPLLLSFFFFCLPSLLAQVLAQAQHSGPNTHQRVCSVDRGLLPVSTRVFWCTPLLARELSP